MSPEAFSLSAVAELVFRNGLPAKVCIPAAVDLAPANANPIPPTAAIAPPYDALVKRLEPVKDPINSFICNHSSCPNTKA